MQHGARRPPGHERGLQDAALRRRRRPRVRVLRHGAALPHQRDQLLRAITRRRGARHVRPGASGADRHADRAADDVAARVAGAQRQARAARRGQRQPGDVPGPRFDLRRPPGLPPPRAAIDRAGRALRPRIRFRARRQDVLRDGHRGEGDHRDRRHRSKGAAPGLARKRPVARHDAERRRQPRLHRRCHRRRHADPRYERDPGAQARPAGARDQPPELAERLDPPERDPVHASGQALRARVRRVHAGDDEPVRQRGRRPRASSTSPTSAGRASSRTCGCRWTRPPTTTPPRAIPAPSARRRATPPTTATSRRGRTRGSSRARSSRRDCASSTSATCATPWRSRTTSRPRRRRPRTATTAATTRCLSQRSRPGATRSGTRTARPASTSCASRTGYGRRRLAGGPQSRVGGALAQREPRLGRLVTGQPRGHALGERGAVLEPVP